jgi:hypothetical protein
LSEPSQISQAKAVRLVSKRTYIERVEQAKKIADALK